jgi:hypothetical protein
MYRGMITNNAIIMHLVANVEMRSASKTNKGTIVLMTLGSTDYSVRLFKLIAA